LHRIIHVPLIDISIVIRLLSTAQTLPHCWKCLLANFLQPVIRVGVVHTSAHSPSFTNGCYFSTCFPTYSIWPAWKER